MAVDTIQHLKKTDILHKSSYKFRKKIVKYYI